MRKCIDCRLERSESSLKMGKSQLLGEEGAYYVLANKLGQSVCSKINEMAWCDWAK